MRSGATAKILGLAGLAPDEMSRYMVRHSDTVGRPPQWLLDDLARVSNPAHLACWTGDGAKSHMSQDLRVTTFHGGAPLPRIWASMPGSGTARGGTHGVHDELT